MGAREQRSRRYQSQIRSTAQRGQVGGGVSLSPSSGFHGNWKSSSELLVCPAGVRKKNLHRWRVTTIGTTDTPGGRRQKKREPTMNQISTLKDAADEGKTAADGLEYGRHTVPQVKDPGDYHGTHRSEEATRAA